MPTLDSRGGVVYGLSASGSCTPTDIWIRPYVSAVTAEDRLSGLRQGIRPLPSLFSPPVRHLPLYTPPPLAALPLSVHSIARIREEQQHHARRPAEEREHDGGRVLHRRQVPGAGGREIRRRQGARGRGSRFRQAAPRGAADAPAHSARRLLRRARREQRRARCRRGAGKEIRSLSCVLSRRKKRYCALTIRPSVADLVCECGNYERGGERLARIRGRRGKCERKSVDRHTFSQAAGEVRARMPEQAHPQPDENAAAVGLN
jgi:hypothetical protein